MKRQVLAVVALVGLLASAGCLGYITGPSQVPDKQLDEEPARPYTWNATQDVHITVTQNATFLAVYNLSNPAFDGKLEVFRKDSLGGKNPLEVRAVRYMYPNGTVITGSQFAARNGSITQTRKQVIIDPPAGGGQLAFTAGSTPKRFTLPVFVEGSYQVVLPPDRKVSAPVIGNVIPRPDRTQIDSRDRTHIYWEEVTASSVVVQFYLDRDVRLFLIIGAVLGMVGVAGLLLFRRQIQRLREQREEMGLDVDTDSDDFGDDGPPPGMR